MGSRSCFSHERPQIPHLLPRRRGGLSGEILDLRLDVDKAFDCLEDFLEVYLTVEDEELPVLNGPMTLNFVGAGVAAALDPLIPGRVNVVIPGTSAGGSGNIQANVPYSLYPSSVIIGFIDAGRTVEKATLEVTQAFDVPVQVTVGDDVGEGRFLTVDDSNLLDNAGEVFVAESGYRYLATTAVKLYFVEAPIPPTRGAVRVVVYFS
jgi:hypothetical protein